MSDATTAEGASVQPATMHWSWEDPTLVDRAPARLVLLAAGASLAFDIGIRGQLPNAAVLVGISLVVALLVTDGRVERPGARLLAASALIPAVFLVVRASPWLAVANLSMAASLIGAAVVHARSGSLFDSTPLRVARRLGLLARRGLSSFILLRPLAERWSAGRGGQAVRMFWAAVIALPLLAMVVGLLASADAVFAELVVPNVDGPSVLGHLVVAGVLLFGVLAASAMASGEADDVEHHGWFGTIEVVTMLALAAAVIGLFVVSQLVALTDAGRRVVEAAGVTPAEYARSGFFQLCLATGVLVVFLAVVRGLAAPGVMTTWSVRLLGGLVPLLSLGLVVVSLRRMALYDRAFGLTMLRFWVVLAAVWLASVLVMMALRNVGIGRERAWVMGGAAVVAAALVVAVDVVNPEAFVVRHNIDRARSGAVLDAVYLSELSADAVPALRDSLAQAHDPALVAELRRAMDCYEQPATGISAANLAEMRAASEWRALCER